MLEPVSHRLLVFIVIQWAKNLDQKISLKIHTPDERELKKLGGRVLQRCAMHGINLCKVLNSSFLVKLTTF